MSTSWSVGAAATSEEADINFYEVRAALVARMIQRSEVTDDIETGNDPVPTDEPEPTEVTIEPGETVTITAPVEEEE